MGAPEYYLQSLLPTSCNLWLGVSFGQHLCMADLLIVNYGDLKSKARGTKFTNLPYFNENGFTLSCIKYKSLWKKIFLFFNTLLYLPKYARSRERKK